MKMKSEIIIKYNYKILEKYLKSLLDKWNIGSVYPQTYHESHATAATRTALKSGTVTGVAVTLILTDGFHSEKYPGKLHFV